MRNASSRIAFLILFSLLGGSSFAANVTVTNTLDAGPGSLRQALASAGNGDTVIFSAGVFNVPQTINVLSELTPLQTTLTITGPGAKLLTIKGNDSFTIFNLGVAANTYTISGMTITGGNGTGASDTSGALYSSGNTVTLNDITVSGNKGKFAGGVYTQGGSMTMNRCTISGNQGILPAGNFNNAGGICNDGPMTLINCTVSGNSVVADGESGAGIEQFNGSATITNCTITNNTCTTPAPDIAGGIRVTQGTVTVYNSIVAGNVNNTSIPDVSLAGGSTFVSSGHNIIGNTGAVTVFTQAQDRTGSGAAPLDPLIAVLGNYGGPTQTHVPFSSSPAVDAASGAGAPTIDQRGLTRPAGGNYDVGSVETQLGILPATLATGTVGTAYAGTAFSGTGGTGPYTFSTLRALPAGLTLTGSSLSGIPTQAGTFRVDILTLDANGFGGAVTYSLVINPAGTGGPGGGSLALISAPTATPANPGVGQTVSFSASASDGTGTLTYAWNFGDGSAAGSGAAPTHMYAVAGVFTATVTVTDSASASVTGTVNVTVSAPLVGTGPDSDGDGYSDGVEVEFGTMPNDPASTPTGVPGRPTLLPLAITTVAIKLNFAKMFGDSATVTGTLPIPAGFAPGNAKFALDLAGATRVFTLNPKGSAKLNKSSAKLTYKSKKGVVAAQTGKFTVAIKSDTLTTALSLAGLTNADVKLGKATIVVTLISQQSVYQKSQPLNYKAKKNKMGTATKKKTEP